VSIYKKGRELESYWFLMRNDQWLVAVAIFKELSNPTTH